MIILRSLNPTIQGRLELLSLSLPLPKSQLKAGGQICFVRRDTGLREKKSPEVFRDWTLQS